MDYCYLQEVINFSGIVGNLSLFTENFRRKIAELIEISIIKIIASQGFELLIIINISGWL
ncbi:MAG: hypothetical protein F6K14_21085 [Symploca sp. SIO2C1]|nr:hypothetical protein [Symploca sp. SIO2C1]